MHDEIVELILETARELGEDELGNAAELGPDSVLFGEDGTLDSMGLVTLIVAVEQAIEDKYETGASLADEKAMSQAQSPYRTVSTLAEYAAAQLEGA